MHALQGRYCSHNWGCGPNFAYLGWKHALQTTGAQSRLSHYQESSLNRTKTVSEYRFVSNFECEMSTRIFCTKYSVWPNL